MARSISAGKSACRASRTWMLSGFQVLRAGNCTIGDLCASAVLIRTAHSAVGTAAGEGGAVHGSRWHSRLHHALNPATVVYTVDRRQR